MINEIIDALHTKELKSAGKYTRFARGSREYTTSLRKGLKKLWL